MSRARAARGRGRNGRSCRSAECSNLQPLEPRRLLAAVLDWGDAPDSYGTLLASGGASHVVSPDFRLGNAVDAEPDGQPSPFADGDDTSGATPDDEDGITVLDPLRIGSPARIEIANGLAAGWLNAWIDFNRNGAFDPSERIVSDLLLPAGKATVTTIIVPFSSFAGSTFARFRLSDTGGGGPTGPAGAGEVEDYRITLQSPATTIHDYGDAPDVLGGVPRAYGTTLASAAGNPARHALTGTGPRLGALVDAEPDGRPHALALGDDGSPPFGPPDDEDGITGLDGAPIELVTLRPGQVTTFEINNTGTLGFLNGWIDWDQDGTWSASERVFTNASLPRGVNLMPMLVPITALPGDGLFARFRVSSQTLLSPTGAAADGEVEDYRLRLSAGGLEVLSGVVEFDTRQAVRYFFASPIDPSSVDIGDLRAVNLTTGQPAFPVDVEITPDGQAVTWRFSAPGSPIPDGNYAFDLAAGSVVGAGGEVLREAVAVAGGTRNAFYLAGDANRDRAVNLIDFGTLAARFNGPGRFMDGDFDYSGTVDLGDFSLMAARFNTELRIFASSTASRPGDLSQDEADMPRLLDDILR